MTRRLLVVALALLAAGTPLGAQAPRAGSVAVGLGFGFNTAGVLGMEVSARVMASDRLALGCRLVGGMGSARMCGANLYAFDRRKYHLVAEVGRASSGGGRLRKDVAEAWFANVGGGVEDWLAKEDEDRNVRVHFTIGPSIVLATRTRPFDGGAPWSWGARPRVFNHTDVLLYPVIR